MAITRPFAYNTGSTISGTIQVGDLAVGEPSTSISGVSFWNGPDEEIGFVIAVPVSGNTQPTPESGVYSSVGFYRTQGFLTDKFKSLAQFVANKFNNPVTFSSDTEASNWMMNNGFWNSYVEPTPTPTPTPTSTPIPTSTPTPTPTPIPTSTPTPTPTTVPTGYTNTAEVYYDPSNTSSYSGSGTVLTNIGTEGNVAGTLGTLSGVVYESSTAGGTFNFDGVTDRISFNTYNLGNTITTTAWVYPRSEFSINCLMSNCGANTNTNGFKMSWNGWNTTNLNMNFEAGNGTAGGTQITANNTIVQNQWQHIAYVFDKVNRTIKFYRNGVEIATTGGGTPVANIQTNSTWWIGAIGGSSYYMNANLGQFRVYKTLRSGADILSEYNGTKTRYGL